MAIPARLRLANIALAPKLMAGVIALSLVAIGLTLAALSELTQQHGTLLAAQRDSRMLHTTGQVSATLLSYVRNIEFLPLEMEASRRTGFEDAARQDLQSVQQQVQALSGTLRLPENQVALRQFEQGLQRYQPIAQRVQALSRAADYEQAGRIAFEAVGLVDDLRAAIRGISDRIGGRVEAERATAVAAYDAARQQFILTAGLAVLLIGSLAIWIVLSGVVRPLRRLTATIASIAGGKLDVDVPGAGRGDELGQMASAVTVLRDNSREALRLQAAAEQQQLAALEERRQARLETAETFDASVGAVVQRLAADAAALQQAANQLGRAAGTSADAALHAASGADQASSNVQQVSAAAEQLTVSVSEITRQVSQAADVARRAVAQTSRTDATVQSLAEGARRIEDVVRLISDVAGQTNLLALNATIEAARAGEAGKGFAVVASEVKNLASQTAKATEEIAQQIAAIQGATGEAVTAIRGIGSVVAEVDEIAAAIAAAVEEQGAATREIARNISEAAGGTNAVSASLVQVRDATGETSASVTALRQVGDSVGEHSSRLQQEVAQVLRQLRA